MGAGDVVVASRDPGARSNVATVRAEVKVAELPEPQSTARLRDEAVAIGFEGTWRR